MNLETYVNMKYIQAKRQISIIDYDNMIKRKKLTDDSDSLSIQSITRFEDFSNELFYEIFDFLDVYHIYKTFTNLNIRFNNLINSTYPLKINLTSISKSIFQDYYTNIILPNKHRIQSLHLSNPFIVDLILSPVRIVSKLIRLEILILNNIKSKYLSNILNHLISLPNLHSLIIIPIDSIRNSSNLYHQIFNLPVLKYCKLSLEGYNESESLKFATNQFSSIEHLVITHTIHLNKLLILLSYIPKIRRLSLDALYGSDDYNRQSIKLNYLTHVYLNIKNINFEQLELVMIDLFHHIQVLHISLRYNETYLNANQWEKFILLYLPYLRIFDFQCINYITNSNNNDHQLIYDNIIEKFNSSFWFERKWFFAYQFYKEQYRDHVIFYSANPYRKKEYTLYKQLNNIHHQENNVDLVNYINIQSEQTMINCTNYFSNVNQLKLSESFSESRIWLRIILNRIIPLKQLTKLIIDCKDFHFEQLIQLLRLTPNVHTLKLECQSINQTNSKLIQKNETFRFVSNMNNIKNVTITERFSTENTELIIILCSQLIHLTIDINKRDIKRILQLLLSKNNINTHHLSSLCIKVNTKSIIRTLKTLIKNEKLLDDYLIKQIRSDLYLWW